MTTGGCLCGQVRFEATGPFEGAVLCYCGFCQKVSGAAFSGVAPLPVERYRLLSGKDPIGEFESSPGVFRAFCSSCGSSLYARVAADPGAIRLRLGSLDDGSQVQITAHAWVSSKPAWHTIGDDLPQYARGLTGPLMRRNQDIKPSSLP
jgi:hypothetical protein